MKLSLLAFVFVTFGLSQAHALFSTRETRDARCTSRPGTTKFCTGDVAFRCDYDRSTCVSLKVAKVSQTFQWGLFEPEHLIQEDVVPTDIRKHGARLYAGTLRKLKKQCEEICERPADDGGSGGGSSGTVTVPDPSAQPPTNTCSGTIWCNGIEHCVNGRCVSRDAFNRCDAFNTCTLGETCTDGVCGR